MILFYCNQNPFQEKYMICCPM
uniref:Uncharacterized protein n=1 Tax=Rhizophora mucronata TaxID=61149 RepID=A0A2P2NVZ5_RHIMU